MSASLIVLVPSEVPFEVRLDQDKITVGRAEQNVLPLRDMNVSRHHFGIERRGEHWLLSDLRSRNGTLVNGVAVLNKLLTEGDRIQVGNSQLTFRSQATPRAIGLEMAPRPISQTPGSQGRPGRSHPLGATSARPAPHAPAQAPSTLPFQRERVAGNAPAQLPAGFGLSPAPAPGALGPGLGSSPPPGAPAPATAPAGGRSKGDTRYAPRPRSGQRPAASEPQAAGEESPKDARWRKLAEVACAINMVHELEQLLEVTLDAVLALVPAKSAFLVMVEGDELVVRAHRNAPEFDLQGDSERLSRQVCREAIEQGRPVLTQDAAEDDNLNQFLSVVNLKLRSILCVPFSCQGEVLGVVYLDEPGGDPFADQGEEVELVGAFGDMAGIAVANARMLAETRKRERLEQELAIAGRIQRSLLPKRAPLVTGLELAGRTVAARGVGGDIFDYFERSEPARDLLVSIGDVAGKGVGAGLVMASVRALLHAYAGFYERTDDLLRHLNRVLARDLEPGIFVSFLLIRYDPATGRMHYTGAGHEHLVVIRPSTGAVEFLRAGGVVLGLMEELGDRIKEETLSLLPGDVVCLYTDGATEAPDADGEEFGLDRVAEAVQAGPTVPAEIVERVIEAVQAFEQSAEPHDDLTVVALRKT